MQSLWCFGTVREMSGLQEGLHVHNSLQIDVVIIWIFAVWFSLVYCPKTFFFFFKERFVLHKLSSSFVLGTL